MGKRGFPMIAQAIGEDIDYVVMLGYFVAVLGFGLYFGRYTSTTKEFFFGGQRFWLSGVRLFRGFSARIGMQDDQGGFFGIKIITRQDFDEFSALRSMWMIHGGLQYD